MTQAQIDACQNSAPGAICSAPQAPEGSCRRQVCTQVVCGDDLTEGDEVCDDGDTDSGDGCRADCLSDERCGNEILDEGETCDDGNTDPGDGCGPRCLREMCGNDELDASEGEVCDDGNTDDGDGCSADCASDESCGNGIIDGHVGEACDDGNTENGDGCDGDCLVEGCGNGVVEEQRGEVCDDGNTESGDGCRADCKKSEECGDGIIDEGESCDDGNQNSGDACNACSENQWDVALLVGQELLATTSPLFSPEKIDVDTDGNLYIADTGNHRIQKVNRSTGTIQTIAGTGFRGLSIHGLLATSSPLNDPVGVDVDDDGNVYIAENSNELIRRLDARSRRLEHVGGVGINISGATDDGELATASELWGPTAVAVDGIENVFFTQFRNDGPGENLATLRAIDSRRKLVSTSVGGTTRGNTGDGGFPENALLDNPQDVEFLPDGQILVLDQYDHRIRVLGANAPSINAFAGDGVPGYGGDGGLAIFGQFWAPAGIGVASDASVYVADTGNNLVRRVSMGLLSTFAGTRVNGFGGDGGAALEAELNGPSDVAIDHEGNVFISDRGNHCVRRVDAETGVIDTYAGVPQEPGRGNALQATALSLTRVSGLTLDDDGNLFISDESVGWVLRVDANDGTIRRVAGTGSDSGLTGVDLEPGSATSSLLMNPRALEFDLNGDLILSAQFSLFRIDLEANTLERIAGDSEGDFGDGGPAVDADFGPMRDIAIADNGDIYVADSTHHRVRRIDATTQTVHPIAGTGSPGYDGEGRVATASALHEPTGVAVDSAGNVFIAEAPNHRVRIVHAGTGLMDTYVGTGNPGHSGDGGSATAAELNWPRDLALDENDNLIIVSQEASVVRRVNRADGTISTIIGDNTFGNSGDGGLATAASLDRPDRVAVGPQGGVYVNDANQRIRRRDPDTLSIHTVAGLIDAAPGGNIADPSTRLGAPTAFSSGGGFTWIASGDLGILQAIDEETNELRTVGGWYPQDRPTGDSARFQSNVFGSVRGVAWDEARGVLYFSESSIPLPNEGPAEHSDHDYQRIRILHVPDRNDPSTWTMSTLAGEFYGFADGPGELAAFGAPRGLLLDGDTLYVADEGAHAIRAIDLSTGFDFPTVTTIAGIGNRSGFDGDGEIATTALLNSPRALALCPGGQIYIADVGNQRVRRLAPDGTMSTVLGTGAASSFSEGAPSDQLPIADPSGLTCDDFGNLYVTSRSTVKLLSAGDAQVVDGSGPVVTIYGSLPRDTYPQNETDCLTGIESTSDTTLRVTDACSGLMFELAR